MTEIAIIGADIQEVRAEGMCTHAGFPDLHKVVPSSISSCP